MATRRHDEDHREATATQPAQPFLRANAAVLSLGLAAGLAFWNMAASAGQDRQRLSGVERAVEALSRLPQDLAEVKGQVKVLFDRSERDERERARREH